jgi:hypothetical protein
MNKFYIYLILYVVLLTTFFFGQTASPPSLQTISFNDLSDTSALKKEISQFTKAGSKKIILTDEKDLLVEIAPWLCTDTTIGFEKGNWIIQNLYVYIAISGKFPKTYIKTFNMAYSDHHRIKIPQIAYSDIYEPHTCELTMNKNKIIQSSKCRVFKRSDQQRVYIYMIIGEGQNEQEVTWVIQNARYLMRVIDKTK